MRTGRVGRRRSMAQRAMLGIIAVLTVAISGVAACLSGYLGASTDAGIRSLLAATPAADAVYQVSVRGSDRVTRSDEAVREQVAALLPDVDHALHRSVVTGPRSIIPTVGDDAATTDDAVDDANATQTADAEGIRGVFGAYPDVAEHADLVAGRWPGEGRHAGAYPVAVHAGGAAGLGLHVGDEFSVAHRGETVDFVIAGLWAPREPESSYWGAAPLEVSGTTDHVTLLATAREADLAAIQGFQLNNRWRLELDLDALTAADVAVLRDALPRLPAELSGDPRLAGAEVAVDGGLAAVVREVHHQIQAARAVTAVPLVLLGVVSIITIALVVHLLAIRREPESALLRTRGAPVGVLTRWALSEALLVTVIPSALGGVAAWALLELLDVGAPISPYAVATGAGVAALLIITTTIATTSRITSVSGRAPVPLTVVTLVIVAAAAAVLGWQLQRVDTLSLTVLDGPLPFDPMVAVLPALALLAGGLLGALAIPVVARAGQRIAARQRGLTGPLAVREVARRPMAYALPVTALVIAVGAATLAAAFTATWSDLQERTAAQRTGADLQVALGDRPATVTDNVAAVNLQPYRTVAGVERISTVLDAPLTSQHASVQMIARSDDSAQPLPGIDLPAGTRSATIELEVESRVALHDEVLAALDIDADDAGDPADGRVRLDLWLADGSGQLSTAGGRPARVPVDAEAESVSSEHAVTVALPGTSGPWRVVAIDLTLDTRGETVESPWSRQYTVAVTAIRNADTGANAQLGSAGRWAVMQTGTVTPIGDDPMLVAAPAGIGVRTTIDDEPWAGPLTARLLPATLATMGTAEPLPVVASDAVLAAHGLTIGDEWTVRWPGGDLPVVIDGSVSAVAGASADQAVAANLNQLAAIQLSTGRPVPLVNRLWLDLGAAAAPDGAAANAVARLAGSDAAVLDRAAIAAQLGDNMLAGQARIAFWATGMLAVVLAAVGLAAGAAAVTRQRSVAVAMLRSVGLSASQQSLSRRREQVLVGASAVVLGAGVGWLVTLLLADRLAATVTSGPTESLHPVTQIALTPWLALAGLALLATVAVAIAHGSWVRRQALAATTPQHRSSWWGGTR